jgi:soluble epoxide hydrolase / lipid-phosphate phosphatase
MRLAQVTEHVATSARHQTFYLASGPENGPVIVFVHGWPELSVSWRHQLPVLGALGFRAIAPDMRGYGQSDAPDTLQAYVLEHIVADMLELLDAVGGEQAVWVGHDWGAPVVWSIASHHPERCHAVAGCSVPYYTLERGLDALVGLVDRDLYPEDEYPVGQWDYMLHYEENFNEATSTFEADTLNTVKALFRKGEAARASEPAYTAFVRRRGGWFGGRGCAPDLPLDRDVLSEVDLHRYAAALQRNGFFGPNAWYMNHAANASYAASAHNEGYLELPVLFLAGAFDYTCECITSRLAAPMGERCADLRTVTIPSGHWMAQERPFEVNAALVGWLAARVGSIWPCSPELPAVRTGVSGLSRRT